MTKSKRSKQRRRVSKPYEAPRRAVDDDAKGENESSMAIRTLQTLIYTLVAWLHLCCGLSRESASKFLNVLGTIMFLAMKLGAILAGAPVDVMDQSRATLKIPKDIRTILPKLSLEPTLSRSICCPACFKAYSLESVPEVCLARETPRSKPCNTPLLKYRNTGNGQKRIPRMLYSTQSFESWLSWFLSRPGIEDLIDKSYEHPIPTDGIMRCIWDTPSWQSLPAFSTTKGNLTFAFYIDWFNPFTNKLAGKQASCGAIMAVCLNLPPELATKVENTFFIGITPGPKEPTVISITELLDPIIDQFISAYGGIIVPTRRHPEGIAKRIAILPLIADHPGVCKTMGFASHKSENFCWYCTCTLSNLESLDLSSWMVRSDMDIKLSASTWRNATTKKRKKAVFKETGVRWSSMHRLDYRSPVLHTVLGVMHNWMEGVLQHHARVKWGIGAKKVGVTLRGESFVKNRNRERKGRRAGPGTVMEPDLQAMDVDPQAMDVDLTFDEDDIDAMEVQEVVNESQRWLPSVPRNQRASRFFSEQLAPQLDEDWNDEDDTDFFPESDDDKSNDESDNDEDDEDDSLVASIAFTSVQLQAIRECIADVIIPTHVRRPPLTFGEASHGKLKADTWFTLFTVFLPMVLVEMWHGEDDNSREKQLLENFYHLVTCTNIVCSYSASETAADNYTAHYITYRQGLQALFPNSPSRPNHHWAMHNGPLLKFWGSLMTVSEFTLEQKNGMLQRIKTNSYIGDLDFTMLRHICRQGRLLAKLHDSAETPEDKSISAFVARLTDDSPPLSDSQNDTKLLSEPEIGLFNKNGEALSDSLYDSLFNLLGTLPDTAKEPLLHRVRDRAHFQINPGQPLPQVLSQRAVRLRRFTLRGHTFSIRQSHMGGSLIIYCAPGTRTRAFGYITDIWVQSLPSGRLFTFLLVSPLAELSDKDKVLDPFAKLPALSLMHLPVSENEILLA